ncbi:MAG: FitA-like ribbon-helix-helix domain-containing protein [Gammaproteobacteria bacterium]
MAQLVVRNLEDDVKMRLRRRASRNGHSMEEEVRTILRDAVKTEATRSIPLGSRISARFAAIGLDHDIEELRGQPVRPAIFKR